MAHTTCCLCLLAGPLYCHSMFRPEGRWAQYKRSLANARYPEANMVLTAADKEMVLVDSVLRRGGAGAAADNDEASA